MLVVYWKLLETIFLFVTCLKLLTPQRAQLATVRVAVLSKVERLVVQFLIVFASLCALRVTPHTTSYAIFESKSSRYVRFVDHTQLSFLLECLYQMFPAKQPYYCGTQQHARCLWWSRMGRIGPQIRRCLYQTIHLQSHHFDIFEGFLKWGYPKMDGL